MQNQNPEQKRSEKADASRTRILDAAAHLFRDKGYASVNLRDIAARSGMQAGSLYYHFDSKEAIVIAILDAGIEAVHGEVKAATEAMPEDSSAAEIIHQGILAHLRSLFEFSHYTSANVRIYGQVPPQVRKANMKARSAYENLWDDIIRTIASRGEMRPDINPKHLRMLLIGSLNATLDWFDPKRGKLNELADTYAQIMLHGLLKPQEASR